MPLPGTLSDSRCAACLKHPPAFDVTIVASDYLAPVEQLVLALKFGARLPLAPLLAELLAAAAQQHAHTGLASPALLSAVPLSKQRLQERGFNQSLEIARPLARRLHLPLATQLLLRVRDTTAQTTLPFAQRKRNMRAAFVVPGRALHQVQGRHIGMVDDVMTSGATLNEIATTLKHFGAERVTNMVFCRTLSN